jgi:hypothetical protein
MVGCAPSFGGDQRPDTRIQAKGNDSEPRSYSRGNQIYRPRQLRPFNSLHGSFGSGGSTRAAAPLGGNLKGSQLIHIMDQSYGTWPDELLSLAAT